MKKYLAPATLGASLIILAGITYYLAIQLPKKHIAEINLEKVKIQSQETQDRQNQLDQCLEDALNNHRDRWKRNCEGLNRELKEDGSCGLPEYLYTHLDKEYENFRNECLERYK